MRLQLQSCLFITITSRSTQTWSGSIFQVINYYWFGLVLPHIEHCRLSNAKTSLYIYIKYIGFWLVGFYGISTIVAYLIPNPLYPYILNIYDLVWFGFMEYQPL